MAFSIWTGKRFWKEVIEFDVGARIFMGRVDLLRHHG